MTFEHDFCHKNLLWLILVRQPGPEAIKHFSSSAQLSMKFQLLINVEIVKIIGKFRFKYHKVVIYPANKINVKMPTIVGILTFMSRINFSLR